MSQNKSWKISEGTNHDDKPGTHAGSICLSTRRGTYYIFKIEPNGCYATTSLGFGSDLEEIKVASRKLAEQVVKVLNRELPGGKLQVRRKGVKNG